MDPFRAGSLPGQRGLQRVAVAGFGAGRALDQPDGLAAGDVDRGQQGEAPGRGGRAFRGYLLGGRAHRILSSQFDSRTAPASPDFSGWNCVAASAPFSTAAANGSPCVAQVTSAPDARSSPARAYRSA